MSRSEVEAIETRAFAALHGGAARDRASPSFSTRPIAAGVYPKAFLAASKARSLALRRSEDAYVEELFGFVTRARPRPCSMPISRALISTSTASLRARSGSVPRRAPPLRQHAIGAGHRRLRHDCQDRFGIR